MILGSENRFQAVSQLASQSHMFYISGGKSIDKNISLSYWFVIDYCFLVTQWLMITLFFGPEGHMSFNLTPRIFFLHGWKYKKLAWIQFRHFHLGALGCWSPDPHFSLNSCVLFLFLLPYRAFRNPACLASLNTICDILCNFKYHLSSVFNNKSCYGFKSWESS